MFCFELIITTPLYTIFSSTSLIIGFWGRVCSVKLRKCRCTRYSMLKKIRFSAILCAPLMGVLFAVMLLMFPSTPTYGASNSKSKTATSSSSSKKGTSSSASRRSSSGKSSSSSYSSRSSGSRNSSSKSSTPSSRSSSKSKSSKSSSSSSKSTKSNVAQKTSDYTRNVGQSVRRVGTEAAEQVGDVAVSATYYAGRGAVYAGRGAVYAGQSAFDLAELPIDLVNSIRSAANSGKHSPGYDQAVKVIGKSRFSRSLSALASRAVARHPMIRGRYSVGSRSMALLSGKRRPTRSGMVTPCWGTRISRGVTATHDGLDIMAPTGTPIYAALPGVVLYNGCEFSGYGNLIILAHGNDLYTLYAHNSRNIARFGAKVGAGERIAEVGSTGRSSAPHLHFEIRHESTPIEPRYFLNL